MGEPLDPKKAFFYGQFVQAAYIMFRDPQGGDALRPEPSGHSQMDGSLGHGSTCRISSSTSRNRSSTGSCAGRQDADTRIIAIRGTEGAIEWIDDAAAIPTPFRQVPSAGAWPAGSTKSTVR